MSKSHTAERSAISDLGGAAENLTFSTVLESKVTTGVKILPVWFSPVWDLENYRSYMLALTKKRINDFIEDVAETRVPKGTVIACALFILFFS